MDTEAKLGGLEVLADVIRRHYDLGEVEAPRPLEAVHQRRHRKLVVTTSKGTFLVKTYKRDLAVLDALRFQHRLSRHLTDHGLPVARIQRARDGKRIVEQDTWALELQQFIEGEPMQVTQQTLAISAKALGMFHEVCRDFPCPPRDARVWRFSEVPRSSLGKLYEAAKASGDEAEATRHCNAIALFLSEAGEALSMEARNEFETGLIHGDWHGGNLIFRDGTLVAIVDLEFAGDGCFLEDLAYGMSNLCIRTSVKPERLKARTDLLIEHYEKYRTLSWLEKTALFYAVGIKHVATVAYQMEQQQGAVAGLGPDEWMARLDAQCAWLREQAEKARWGER